MHSPSCGANSGWNVYGGWVDYGDSADLRGDGFRDCDSFYWYSSSVDGVCKEAGSQGNDKDMHGHHDFENW